MTTVMKASSSADFLAMVPALAGFTPTRSVVLVPFEGKRAYGAMRMDLPPDDALDAFVAAAADLTDRIEGSDAAAVVVYSDEAATSTPDGPVLPQTVLVERLLDELDRRGRRIVDALCAMPEGWASYLDERPRVRPLPVPVRPEGMDEEITGDQDDGADLPVVDLAEKERVGRALEEVTRAVSTLRVDGGIGDERTDPRAIQAVLLLDDIPALLEDALHDPDGYDPFVTAALLWLLGRPVLRDAALMQWMSDLPHGRAALLAQLSYPGTGEPPAAEHRTMMLGLGRRPDMDRLLAALATARALAARAPRDHRIGPLAIASWSAWALGRPSHADRYLAEIAQIDPEYGFLDLMRSLMRLRPLPDWAFHRRADLADDAA